MKADTGSTDFNHNLFMFEIPGRQPAAGTEARPPRNCDMCDLSGTAGIYRCASGIGLCSECQGDLMGMPGFTRQQIGRFLIGNVL